MMPRARLADRGADPPPKPPRRRLRPPPKPAAPAPTDSRDTTVYRSGVIDGMAYTLFMDGSIEAELPQGIVKFASVDDLQKYLRRQARSRASRHLASAWPSRRRPATSIANA